VKRWFSRPSQRAAIAQQTIFDGLPDAAFIYDAESRLFMRANPAAEALLGYTQDEFLAMTPVDLHPPEERATVQHRLTDDSDCGAHRYRVARKDGSLVPVEIHSSSITYEGRPAYLSVMRDITEREAQRSQVEELARLAAEAPTPILRLGSNGAVLYANQAARSLLVRQEDGSYCAPRQWAAWVRDALRADRPVQTEAIVGTQTCLLTFVPVMARGYVNVYSLDMTEQIEAAEQLRQERDLAESLFSTAPVIVIVFTPEGRVIRANRYTEQVLGHAEHALTGRDWIETMVPEPERAGVRQAFQRAVDGHVVAGYQNRVYTIDGGTRLVEWFTGNLYDAEGCLAGVLAVGHDITERQELETRLRLAQKAEAVGQLAGGIAHDFNNLLQVINGNIEFVLMEPCLPPQCRQDLGEVRKAGRRAAELTSQLLAYSRQQSVQLGPVDLNQLLTQTQSLLARTLDESITIELALEEAPPYAIGDEAQLERALLNLALNARDAMPHGGKITMATRRATLDQREAELLGLEPGTYAVIRVSDTGQGMEQEILEHAFEPFYTTKEVGKGTGLGLAQVYGIVTQCAGAVSVESIPENGTTFRLYLPLTEGPAKATPAPEPSPTGAGETILVVEDDDGVRRLAVRLLAGLGYRTIEAASVVEAVDRAYRAQGKIDLLLTDLIMPDGTGIECARQIEQRRPGLSVVYMSGYPEDAARLAQMPRDGRILQKPFTLPQIAAAVAEELRGHPTP
jgi:PAS domain S-box-containing protein